MLLQPNLKEHRKQQRNSTSSVATNNIFLYNINSFGLRALESIWITAKQIEATRKAIIHTTKRVGKVRLRIYPDKSLTARSKESRMGSGKGSVDIWVANVRLNTIIFEIFNLSDLLAIKALKAAQSKLPIKTEIISN